MTKNITFALFLLILFLACIFLWLTLTPSHNWGDDFAAYIMQAKSIVEFTQFNFVESNRFAMEQSSRPIGPIAYPWGFPLMLAPFYALFGLNLIAMKIVGTLSFILILGLLWYRFRKVHSPSMLLCLLGFFALNPTLLLFSNQILSDLPFLFLSTLSVFMIESYIVDRHHQPSRIRDSILIGFVIALSFFVRSNGALLLITLGFSYIVSCLREPYIRQLLNREKGLEEISLKSVFLVRIFSLRELRQHSIPYLVFFFFVVITSMVFPQSGGGHLSYFKSVSLQMIIDHLYYYSVLLSNFYSGVPYHKWVYLATIPFAVAGMISRFWTAYPAIIYSALTLLLYILWPDTQGLRFLFPILPFYLSFIFSGLETVSNSARAMKFGNKLFRNVVCYTPLFLIILFFSISSSRAYQNNSQIDGPFSETSKNMFDFIEKHTDEASIVVFRKPRVLRLLTNRKSIMINNSEQIFRGDYLCLSLKHNNGQIPISEAREISRQGMARLVYENDDFLVYHLNQDKIQHKQ